MNENMKSAFNGRKAKIISIALCAALLLSVGTLTAFAATSENFQTLTFFQSGEISGLSIKSSIKSGGDGSYGSFESSHMLRFEDGGAIYHSTDGGETWIEGLPEGVILEGALEGAGEYDVNLDFDDVSFSVSYTITIDE